MFVRKKLTPDEISPPNLRYDEDCSCVQQTIDGGATWFNAPQSDPRAADCFRYPPRTGGDPKCDAAHQMRLAIQNYISSATTRLAETGNAVGAISILLVLLDLLGGFGLLVTLIIDFCNLILSIGVAAVDAAFTTSVYDQLECIFFCDISDDGTITSAEFSKIQTDISTQFGSLSDVNIVMQGVLNTFGAVGLSNAGVLGSEAGDCSSCECEWCYEWDFSIEAFDWASTAIAGWHLGAVTQLTTYGAGGWNAGIAYTRDEGDERASFFFLTHYAASSRFTHVEIDMELTWGNTSIIHNDWAVRLQDGALAGIEIARIVAGTNFTGTLTWDGDATLSGVNLQLGVGVAGTEPDAGGAVIGYDNLTVGGAGKITRILMRGKGDSPFGANNC